MNLLKRFEDFLTQESVVFRAILTTIHNACKGGVTVLEAHKAALDLKRQEFFSASKRYVTEYIKAQAGTVSYSRNVVTLAAAMLTRYIVQGDMFVAALRARLRSIMSEWTNSADEIVQIVPSYEKAREERDRVTEKAMAKRGEKFEVQKAKSFYGLAKDAVDKQIARGNIQVVGIAARDHEVMKKAVKIASQDPEILRVWHPVRMAGEVGTVFFLKAQEVYDQVFVSDVIKEMLWVDEPVFFESSCRMKKTWKTVAREACAASLVIAMSEREFEVGDIPLYDIGEDGGLVITGDHRELDLELGEFEEIHSEVDSEISIFEREDGFDGRMGALINAPGGRFARTLDSEKGDKPFDGLGWDEDINFIASVRGEITDNVERLSTKQLLGHSSAIYGSDAVRVVDVALLGSDTEENVKDWLIANTRNWKMYGQGVIGGVLDSIIDRFVAFYSGYDEIPPSVCRMSAQNARGWQFGKPWYAEAFGKVSIGIFGAKAYLVHRVVSPKMVAYQILNSRLKAAKIRISNEEFRYLLEEMSKTTVASECWEAFPGHLGKIIGIELRGDMAHWILRNAGYNVYVTRSGRPVVTPKLVVPETTSL